MLMAPFQKLNEAFQNYLKRMEKENRELFGGEKPSCCKLNQKQKPKNNSGK